MNVQFWLRLKLLAVDYVAWLYRSVDEQKSEFACLYPKLFTFETVKYRKNILVLSSNAVYINRSSNVFPLTFHYYQSYKGS